MIAWYRTSHQRYPWTWEALYRVAGVSRQAVYKYEQQKQIKLIQIDKMIDTVEKVRQSHRKMGLKKIYLMHSDKIQVGRDVFLRLMVKRGYGIRRKRSFHMTTKSLKDRYFPNLIKGLKIYSANRVWQSDITYFKYRKRHLYLTLIIDEYTRYIVGYHLDNNMYAETMIGALEMAMERERIDQANELIHHSDRGSQYGSQAYVNLLRSNNIQISMCTEAYENAYAERLNQTIKNEYLEFVRLDGAKNLTMAFKKYIETITKENRPKNPHYLIY